MRETVLLDDLEREYTLSEIAIVTRAGPARLLGMTNKGQLGVGADADVTIYDDRPDREEMFALPRYVVKGGRVVVRDGELVERVDGTLLRSAAPFDEAIEGVLERDWRYSIGFRDYPVREPWLLEPARRVG
jgi:formylmethanofuran dehydrogenase subunit A